MHVGAVGRVCFASDGAVTEVECALAVDAVFVCMRMPLCCPWMNVCVCVLMVPMHAVAARWGVVLLSVIWKSVRALSELLDTFLTWGEKEEGDRWVFPVLSALLLSCEGSQTSAATTWVNVSVCVLVPPVCSCPHGWVCTLSHGPSPATHASLSSSFTYSCPSCPEVMSVTCTCRNNMCAYLFVRWIVYVYKAFTDFILAK